MNMTISYSGWGTFKDCPAKFRYRYIDKVEVPELEKSTAASRGTDYHNSLEEFFKEEDTEVPAMLAQKFGHFLFTLKQRSPVPEQKYAYTWQWEPCDFDDPEAMTRGVIDLVVGDYSPEMFEWKTGKEYETHHHQRMKYAMVGMLQFPDVEQFSVTGVYFDKSPRSAFITDTYTREQLPELQKYWKSQFLGIKVLEPRYMVPNPSPRCRWCHYSNKAGGPCKF